MSSRTTKLLAPSAVAAFGSPFLQPQPHHLFSENTERKLQGHWNPLLISSTLAGLHRNLTNTPGRVIQTQRVALSRDPNIGGANSTDHNDFKQAQRASH